MLQCNEQSMIPCELLAFFLPPAGHPLTLAAQGRFGRLLGVVQGSTRRPTAVFKSSMARR
jgi:hypothetical protein